MHVNNNPEWVGKNLQQFQASLNGHSRVPLNEVRNAAFERFQELGLPHRKIEAWRYTDVSVLQKNVFSLPSDNKPSGADKKEIENHLLGGNYQPLVFFNGQYQAGLSQVDSVPKNAYIGRLADAMRDDHPAVKEVLNTIVRHDAYVFAALNTAFVKDGLVVFLPRGTVLEKPVQVLFYSNSDEGAIVTHPRILIVAEENTQATVVESYAGRGEHRYFVNPVVEVQVGVNAVIEHIKLQHDAENAVHISVQQSRQSRSSNFATHSMTFGGGLVRNDIRAVLDGEGAIATMNGLYMLHDRQHADHHTMLEHAQPHGSSRQLYKGILDDETQAVFNGKIYVHQIAQKTDAIQNNKNLLLSKKALVDTQPMLEIFADDVRCTHGGTVGQLDRDGLFYLRSRGIKESLAKKIMIQSFAGDVVDQIRATEVRERMEDFVVRWLEQALMKQEKMVE